MRSTTSGRASTRSLLLAPAMPCSRAAQPHEVRSDGDGSGEQAQREGEGAALAYAALEHGMAGARRSDRVDALPDVVDLIDYVGAGVEEHSAGQGGQERQQRKVLVQERECSAGEHRNGRGGVGERPNDLVGSGEAATTSLEQPEPAVVGEPDRVDRIGGALPGRTGDCLL